MIVDIFLHLLRLGTGLDTEANIGCKLSDDEWAQIIDLGRKHAVLGLLFAGIEKLPADMMPPKALALKLYALTVKIREANVRLNAKCAEVTETLSSLGYDSCVLKGQGVARMYPDPLLRQSGDIDIWVRPKDKHQCEDHDAYILKLIQDLNSTGLGSARKFNSHHIDWHRHDVEVEVHYHISYFCCPKYNRVLHDWELKQWHTRVLADGYYMPSPVFNAVYMMMHIYRHYLGEGIGLRQIIDYAVLLNSNRYSADGLASINDAIDSMGMKRFSGALMWVLAELLHVPNERLITEPVERDGKDLYYEIMQTGNFGKYDKRKDSFLKRYRLGRILIRNRHRVRFIASYPQEVIWYIPHLIRFKLWKHRIQRRLNDLHDGSSKAPN